MKELRRQCTRRAPYHAGAGIRGNVRGAEGFSLVAWFSNGLPNVACSFFYAPFFTVRTPCAAALRRRVAALRLEQVAQESREAIDKEVKKSATSPAAHARREWWELGAYMRQ